MKTATYYKQMLEKQKNAIDKRLGRLEHDSIQRNKENSASKWTPVRSQKISGVKKSMVEVLDDVAPLHIQQSRAPVDYTMLDALSE